MNKESESVPTKRSRKPARLPRKVKSARAQSAAVVTEEWIEVFPSGVSVGSDVGRPVLILKDKSGDEVLPVWLQPLDAGVAIAGLSQTTGSTPHKVTRKLLDSLGLRLESCYFVDLVGHHQFVQLKFQLAESSEDARRPAVPSLRVRADEAMSFCLELRARFYSTRAFMVRCRNLDGDLAKFEQSLLQGDLPALSKELEKSSKKNPYMM